MSLSSLSFCARARALLPRLLAGRASNAALARHVGTCPRCRAELRAALDVPPGRPDDPAAYVLAVVRAAGRARLATLLEELARACAAGSPGLAVAPRARPAAAVLADVQRLQRRLGPDGGAMPDGLLAATGGLAAARACLRAAERLDGPSPERRLVRAACALAADDAASAGALCSELAVGAGRRDERTRLERRAAGVARDWGLAPRALAALLAQPAPAGCN